MSRKYKIDEDLLTLKEISEKYKISYNTLISRMRSGRYKEKSMKELVSYNHSFIKDLTGQKFHKLKVLKFSHINKNGLACWDCQCDCGTIKKIIGASMVNGSTKSCGCLRNKQKIKHGFLIGMYKKERKRLPQFYRIWKSMKQRCVDVNSPVYKRYGAVGIKISDRWKFFKNFYEDMHESYLRYVEEHGDKNVNLILKRNTFLHKNTYCKETVFWGSMKDAKLNSEIYKKNAPKREKLLRLSKLSGKSINTVNLRDKKGWSEKEIISNRKNKRLKHYDFFIKNKKEINKLSENYQRIIKYRYGFIDGVCYSLKETGKKFNLTKQRINNIEKRAMEIILKLN